MSEAPTRSWTHICGLIRCHLGLKVRLTILLMVGITGPFLLLGRYPLRPVFRLEPTSFDFWLGFDPDWVWVYLSFYLLMPIGPLLLTERRQLERYAFGMLGIAAAGFTVFLAFPSATWRPSPPLGAPWAYRLLIAFDAPTNAVPSLHCAFSVFSVLVAERAWRGRRPAQHWRILMWCWAGAICLSTMITKQHLLIDVVTGVALGLVAHPLVWQFPRTSGTAPSNQRIENNEYDANHHPDTSAGSLGLPVRSVSGE